MTRKTADLRLEPITGALGAEVSGITLARPPGDGQLAELRRALLDHKVLVFRDQEADPAQLVAFAARFGPLHRHKFVESLAGHPEVIEIVKEAGETNAWGGGWHSDISFELEPSLGSLLLAREVPPYGGDTLFANMELAYETLPEDLKDRIEGLKAQHCSGDAGVYSDSYAGMNARKHAAVASEHPLVRRHPESGRKILFANPVFTRRIAGLADAESRELLARLFEHALQPAFTCRIRWRPGMAVMWDNRSVLHNAMTDYFPGRGNCGFRRVMHRVTICGDRPR
jgi:taurine dioxygenase